MINKRGYEIMGCIIRIDSEKFIGDFLKNFDPNKFQFLLISKDITTKGKKGKYSNVMAIKALIPPPHIASVFINDGMTKTYKKKYLEYLKKDDNNLLVSTIIKGAINNMNIVLLCSKSEDEFGYLKLLCEFIEDIYNMKTYSYKKFKKEPDKATKISNKDQVIGNLTNIINKLKPSDIMSPDVNKEKLIKRLKGMDREDLYKYCKTNGIKVDKTYNKKELIKCIVKSIC